MQVLKFTVYPISNCSGKHHYDTELTKINILSQSNNQLNLAQTDMICFLIKRLNWFVVEYNIDREYKNKTA